MASPTHGSVVADNDRQLQAALNPRHTSTHQSGSRYIFVSPPLTPFLNTAFIKMDGVFPLFGTALFALFCFYLMGAPLL